MKSIEKLASLSGKIHVPASKSYTVRALLLAAISAEPTTLYNCLDCDDSRYMLEALRKIGFAIDGSLHKEVSIGDRTSMSAGEVELFIGNAGTAMRFLTGALSFTPGRFLLTGEERMKQRPIHDLVDALHTVGAEIEYAETEGYPPLKIRGKISRGGFEVRIEGSVSSQFVSSIMLAAGNLPQGVDIRVGALASKPYLDITRDIIEDFGGSVEERPDGVLRVMARNLSRSRYDVEGDWSSASYWIAAALVTGGRVEITGLREDSPQGDRRFVDLVPQLGGRATWEGATLIVEGGSELHGGTFDMNDIPDVVPSLAAIAPAATSPIEIINIANLRVKESDRIAVLASELRKLGATVTERDDALRIEPGWNAEPAVIDPYGDHRIAMSFAIAGLERGNITIQDEKVVSKSYPRFWRTLDEVT